MSLEEPSPGHSPRSGPEVEQNSLGLRRVSDVWSLRALAHPVRLALLEQLGIVGPMTATERIGESPTTCSFHLRQLAKYGFVEEAGGGKGRARPWRMTSMGLELSSDHKDPEARIAQAAVARMFMGRALERYRNWDTTRDSYPEEWRQAAEESELVLFLTAAELKALNHELLAILLPRSRERLVDPSLRPPGSLPVEMLIFSYPLGPPGQGGTGPAT